MIAREAFFETIKRLGIECLDVLFLTHPHWDHFHGMLDVVDYFTSEGRQLRFFCDIGVDPAQTQDLLAKRRRPESEVREYEALHRRLDQLIGEEKVGYKRLDESSLFHVEDFDGRFELVPIGPEPSTVRAMTRETIERGKPARSLNCLSLVLFLRVDREDGRFKAFLGSDADAEGVEDALRTWGARRGEKDRRLCFDVVKVPHHGSLASHTEKLWKAQATEQEAVAAVSVGTRFAVLPDREVLRDYLNSGWTVLLTTRRGAARRDRALTLSGQRGEREHVERQDIRICWHPQEGLAWTPDKTRIEAGDLTWYATARLA